MSISRNKVYRCDEVSSILKTSERIIRRYCLKKVFPGAKKLCKSWLIPGSDILELFPNLKED